MAEFLSDGTRIAFDDIGAPGKGRPMFLVHGFTSNRNENWRRVGWYSAFERKHVRCVALDCRGHGESAKPRDPAAYTRAAMAGDVLALADHLGIERFHLMGFSMGSRSALSATLRAPERVATLTLGGVGEKFLGPRPPGNPMAEAMEALDPSTISDPMLKSFRQFADEQGEDRLALAALMRAPAEPDWDRAALKALTVPVLVIAGAHDELAGNPQVLADCFGDGRAVIIPGCDHFSVIAHALYKATVFDFLDGTLA